MQTNKHFDLLEILVLLLLLWNEIGVPQSRLLSGDWYSTVLSCKGNLVECGLGRNWRRYLKAVPAPPNNKIRSATCGHLVVE